MKETHPVHRASRSGDVTAVTDLVKNGCDVNVRDEDGWSALHHAVYGRQISVLEALLRLGADINAAEQFGGTPLHWACEVEDAEAVQLLLRSGADVNLSDKKDRTPLHDALFKRNWAIVKLLARADADWLSENPNGHGVASPLHLSRLSDLQEVRRILVQVSRESPQAQRAWLALQREEDQDERDDH